MESSHTVRNARSIKGNIESPSDRDRPAFVLHLPTFSPSFNERCGIGDRVESIREMFY